MGKFFNLKWSRYIPKDHLPTPKQIAFLTLPHEEVLYGGAAGGGKSDALLMGALQYMDDPAYRAILFRLSLTDHDLPESLMNRAREWLAPFFEAKLCSWGRNNVIRFKGGGQLAFGYLDKEGSRGKRRYQGPEFHYIGFDELTHFPEDHYTYIISRLRRKKNDSHIPLRVRAATNPGGVGHAWVKKRWQIEEGPEAEYVDLNTGELKKYTSFVGKNPDMPFIHATVRDNPYLDRKQYERTLDKQDIVTREQLKHGDWSISEDAIHKKDWYKHRWWKKGEYFILENALGSRSIHESNLFTFGCVDTAASEKAGIEGKVFRPNMSESWNVSGIFGLLGNDLLWLDNIRGQWTVQSFCEYIHEQYRLWRPAFARVESNTIGSATCQVLASKNFIVFPVHSSQDKVERNIYALVAAQSGKIWLPDEKKNIVPWLGAVEDELFVWTGKKTEQDDIIDVLSSAAEYRHQRSFGQEAAPLPPARTDVGAVAVGGLRTEVRSMIVSTSGFRKIASRRSHLGGIKLVRRG